MPQTLLAPHRPSGRVISGGPSFGSLRGSFNCALRATMSSVPDPSVQMAKENLERARLSLSRKLNILDKANQALDSLLMKKPRPSPSEIAEAERDVAEAERDVAKAAFESFLVTNPMPSSSDAAATRDFDVKEAQHRRDVAEAEWNLSKADLSFAQATQASDIELDQKRKAEAVWRGIVERLDIASSPGQSGSPSSCISFALGFMHVAIIPHKRFLICTHTFTIYQVTEQATADSCLPL
jgi:hypothetical protein